jgi:hypothetical protein
MSNGDNFDPNMYPELFADDDINPIEMAMLMEAIYGSQQQEQNINEIQEPQSENLFAPPQSESLFAPQLSTMNANPLELLSDVYTPNANGEIEFSEEQLMNDPMLLQMLMQMMTTDTSMFYNTQESLTEEDQISEYIEDQSDNSTTNFNKTTPEICKDLKEEEIKDDLIIEHLKHKKSNKCNFVECKTKLGMLGFDCRCGYKFCSKHRHINDHKCSFDHISFDKDILRKRNTGFKSDKISKIE